jgi:hypothetical protein
MGAFEDLAAGKFFDSIMTPFSTLGIETQIVYAAIWLSVLGILFIRTRSPGVVIIGVMVSSFAFFTYIMPEAQAYVFVVIVITVAWLVYDLIKSR